MKLITLSGKGFAIVLVILFLAIPVWVYLAVGTTGVYAWYNENVRGPTYQKLLGFRTGELTDSTNSRALWGMLDVIAAGEFERAGVRKGDVPRRVPYFSPLDGTPHLYAIGYNGRLAAVGDFYFFLEQSRGRGPVTFTVCSSSEIHDPHCERTVTIEVPAK